MTTPDIELSELEKAIDGRERKSFVFEVPDVLGQSGKSLGQVKMRIATVAEQDQAIRDAHAYAEKIAKNAGAASVDPDLLENAKTANILHKVCRNSKTDSPAFSSPEWMLKKMSVHELGILLNNYNEMKKAAMRPLHFEFDTVQLEAFAQLCGDMSNSSLPNIYLQNYNEDQIAEIAIRMAILYHQKVIKK